MCGKTFAYLFFQVLTSCYVLPLQTQLVNISAANDDVCKIFFKDHQNKKWNNSDGFWSITTVFNQRVTDNRDGRLYIGEEAAIFRLFVPGLYSSNLETISFQLHGHPQVFVRYRADGGVYLDRSNASLEFSKCKNCS
ncbi:Hypothetical predicted protein [Paramuricea clavata]|uniref:Uncharacterized protein n=1 Tax=Paramuricea clavata TaxID=317549 RepID=A0A6S7I3A0_PARCT|nr:Hypothetical predicted protein [Paramuricea clavata]